MSIDSQIPAHAFASLKEALAAHDAFPTRASKNKAVMRNAEFERVKALPWRDSAAYGERLIDALTAIFALTTPEREAARRRLKAVQPDRVIPPIAPLRLRMSQAIAIYEIFAFDGFIGNITMGDGKTLIAFLGATGARTLILMPANLVDAKLDEMKDYALDWRVPGNITIKSYEKMARESHATFLDELKPQRIVCDEAQALKDPKTAVHRRVKRYWQKSKCSFVAFSGTLVGKSLNHWAPAAHWALDLRSPAPRTLSDQTAWHAALSREATIQPGALEDFGDDYREGYAKRVQFSPGVLMTEGASCDASLEIERFETGMSDKLKECLAKLEDTWELPTGEILEDPLSFHRAARQLELGCYLRWKEQPAEEWREMRLLMTQTIREIVRYSRKLDTEWQVINAIEHGAHPEVRVILDAWRKIKSTFIPETECVWVDYTPIADIAARARKGAPCIVWVWHKDVGAALDALGIPYYGAGGKNAKGEYIETASGKASICASIASNHKGRNLQMQFGRSLIAEMSRDPLTNGQLIGRTHRPGQPRDLVRAEYNTTTDMSKRAWLNLLEDAKDVERNSRQKQLLLMGTHTNPLTADEKKRLEAHAR